MIENSPYKDYAEVKSTYQVYVNRTRLHWFLLLKLKDSKLHFITLEASTPDMFVLSHEMRAVSDSDPDANKIVWCGEINARMTEIVNVADKLIIKMKSYNLFTSNCQHFCNNFLQYYSFEVYATTLGKRVTAVLQEDDNMLEEKIFKLITELAAGRPSRFTIELLSRPTAEIVNYLAGANRH